MKMNCDKLEEDLKRYNAQFDSAMGMQLEEEEP